MKAYFEHIKDFYPFCNTLIISGCVHYNMQSGEFKDNEILFQRQ